MKRLFLVAFAVRLLFCASFGLLASAEKGGPLNYPDEDAYRAYARTLRTEGRFADSPLVANRPPGYPVFLAGCQALLGESRWAHALPQAALGALSCLLLARLGASLGLASSGWAAAWILAFWPHHVAYAPLALTETLFVLLFLAALAASAAPPSGRSAALAGLLWGLAALTRPGVLLLPPLAFGAAALARTAPWRWGAIALAAYAATLVPWAVRNAAVLDRCVPVATRMGHDLYESNCPEASGASHTERIRWPADVAGMDEARKDAELRRRALAYMADHPARTFWLSAVKLLRTWSPVPNDLRHRRGIFTLVFLATWSPVLLLLLRRLLRAPPRGAAALWLLLPVVYLTAVHCVFLGSIRYRLPAEPLTILLGLSLPWARRSTAPDGQSL